MALGLSLLVGCDEDLPKATEIERMRLLGAKVEVRGDPERSTPMPGERADVVTMLLTCTQPTRYTGGIPICQELLDAAILGAELDVEALLEDAMAEGVSVPSKVRCREGEDGSILDLFDMPVEFGTVALRCVEGDPSVAIRVDDGFEAEQVLYRGIVCEKTDAEKRGALLDPADPQLFSCLNDDGESFHVHGTVTVQGEDTEPNFNPDIGAAEFLLGNPGEEGGRDWAFLPTQALPPEDDCWESADDFGLLRADSFGDHQITVRYDASVRDEFEGMPEDVEFSLFVTAGELGQRFVLFESEDEAEDGVFEDTVSWRPPLELESRSQIVRFFFTVLDRRGGFNWTTRAVCLR